MNKETFFLLLAFGSLYLVTGTVGIFTSQSIPIILRSQGEQVTVISWLLYIKSIAWMGQFFYAPIVESFQKIRTYGTFNILLSSNILVIACFIFLSFSSPKNFYSLAIFEFVTSLCLSVSSVALNGLAINVIKVGHFAFANSLRILLNGLGKVTGGGLALIVFYQLGWVITNGMLLGIILVLTLPLFFIKIKFPIQTHHTKSLSKISKIFTQNKNLHKKISLIAFSQLGISPLLYISGIYFIDKKLSLEIIGNIYATYGAVATVLASIVGSIVVSKIGYKKSYLLFLGLDFVMLLGFLYSDLFIVGNEYFIGLMIMLSVVGSIRFIAIYSLCMEYSRGMNSTCIYAIFQSVVMIVFSISGVIGGYLAQYLGWSWVFVICLFLSFVAFWVFLFFGILNKI